MREHNHTAVARPPRSHRHGLRLWRARLRGAWRASVLVCFATVVFIPSARAQEYDEPYGDDNGSAGHRLEVELGAGAASNTRHRHSQLLGLIGDGSSDVLRVRSGLFAFNYRAQRRARRGLHAHLEAGLGAGLMVARRAEGGHFNVGFDRTKGATGPVQTYGAGAGIFWGPWGRLILEPGLHLSLNYGDTCAWLQPEGPTIEPERICLRTPIVSMGLRMAVVIALGQGARHALRIAIDAAPITGDGHRHLALSLRWALRLYERQRKPSDAWGAE